jgi:hypothetical protein
MERYDGRGRNRFVEGTVVPKAMLPVIGYVAVAFSNLDSNLDFTIAYLLDANLATGKAIASAITNYSPRIELFERIVEMRITDNSDKKKLLVLSKAIQSVADKRHRLFHDEPSVYSDGQAQLQLYRKEKLFTGAKPTPFTKASLKQLGDQMIDLSYRLIRYRHANSDWKEGNNFPWRER